MPYYEVYQGSKRVKLPIRQGEPVNETDKRNYRWYHSDEKARKEGLKAEHRKFGHDTAKPDCFYC